MATKSATRVSQSSRRATYQDVLDAPPHKVAEIVDGTLHMSPRPSPRHSEAYSGILASVSPPYRYGRGGAWRLGDSRRTRTPSRGRYPGAGYSRMAQREDAEVARERIFHPGS